MPVSPYQRAQQEQTTPEGSSKRRRKSKSKPTTKDRNNRQKTKERYAKAREDAQLVGIIPTTPEGAVRPEQVPPSVQGSQPLPELVAQAIRKGWAVDEGMKPHLVDEMVQIVMNGEMPAKAKIAAFNALRMADESQHDRDNPDKVKDGGPFTLNINVETVDSKPPQIKDRTDIIEVEIVDHDNQDNTGVCEAAPVPRE